MSSKRTEAAEPQSPSSTTGGQTGDGANEPPHLPVTEEMIRGVVCDGPLKTQQRAVSLPLVQQYVDMLLAGRVAPPIKVDGDIIVDGNHRYVAARVVHRQPSIQTWTGGRPGRVVPWSSVVISPESW